MSLALSIPPSKREIARRTRKKDTQKELSADFDHVIRYCLSENKNCNADILDVLSNDVHEYIRMSVAENESTKACTLEKLCLDSDYIVRTEAVKSLFKRGKLPYHLSFDPV